MVVCAWCSVCGVRDETPNLLIMIETPGCGTWPVLDYLGLRFGDGKFRLLGLARAALSCRSVVPVLDPFRQKSLVT